MKDAHHGMGRHGQGFSPRIAPGTFRHCRRVMKCRWILDAILRYCEMQVMGCHLERYPIKSQIATHKSNTQSEIRRQQESGLNATQRLEVLR
jgi:hypothetical protein